MAACSLVILLLAISVLNVLLPSSLCELDVNLENKATYFDEITPGNVKEIVTESAEGVVAFAGNVPASGTVSIVGQSPGYSQYNGFQQSIPPYPYIEAPYPPMEALYPPIETPYLPMEIPFPPYTFIQSAYGSIRVPYTELMYPYMNWYPLYPIPVEYPGQLYPNVYMDDMVDSHEHSVPISGRVRIEANFGSCNPNPYPCQAVSENDMVSPTVKPDYYNNYPETNIAPAVVVNALGEVTIAANF